MSVNLIKSPRIDYTHPTRTTTTVSRVSHKHAPLIMTDSGTVELRR